MRTITLTKCSDGAIWVTSDENQIGTESYFKEITDEKQQMLVALSEFLGYEPYELLGSAFAGCPGWEDVMDEDKEDEPMICDYCKKGTHHTTCIHKQIAGETRVLFVCDDCKAQHEKELEMTRENFQRQFGEK